MFLASLQEMLIRVVWGLYLEQQNSRVACLVVPLASLFWDCPFVFLSHETLGFLGKRISLPISIAESLVPGIFLVFSKFLLNE